MTSGEIIQSSLSIHGGLVLGQLPPQYKNLQMLKSLLHNGVIVSLPYLVAEHVDKDDGL